MKRRERELEYPAANENLNSREMDMFVLLPPGHLKQIEEIYLPDRVIEVTGGM